MLYDDFENKASKISKDFIPTEQTRMIAQKAADELADATIQLKNYETFKPELDKIDDLHSRITTNTKEIMSSAREQHEAQNKEIQKIREDLSGRIGVMEKWRHVLIGGSIVVGFLLHKFMEFS